MSRTRLNDDYVSAELPLTSDVEKYSNEDYPIYSKSGRTVCLRGAVKVTSQVAADGTVDVGTLPVGFRPSTGVVTLCQASGVQIFMCRVYPSGLVRISRYRNNTGYVAIPTTAWLPLYATFQT